MTKQIKEPFSTDTRWTGQDVLAAMYALAAFAWVVAVVLFYVPFYGASSDFRPALRDLLLAIIPALLFTILLLTIGWGLWKRLSWARLLALIINWPFFLGAVGLLPICLYVLLLVPARGIAVGHGIAFLGVFILTPVLLLTGWTLWYLNKIRRLPMRK